MYRINEESKKGLRTEWVIMIALFSIWCRILPTPRQSTTYSGIPLYLRQDLIGDDKKISESKIDYTIIHVARTHCIFAMISVKNQTLEIQN